MMMQDKWVTDVAYRKHLNGAGHFIMVDERRSCGL